MDKEVLRVDLPGLQKLASGKVRDIYVLSASTLLFVSTDRTSEGVRLYRTEDAASTDLAALTAPTR